MKSLYKRFKELTGFSYTDMAERLGVTRQAIDHMLRNYSITHINASKWLLTQMIDEAIERERKQISELEELKKQVKEFKSCKGADEK